MKLLLTTSLLLITSLAIAQSWAPTGKAQKFSEVIATYEAQKTTSSENEKAENEPFEKQAERQNIAEDKNYHFARWAWYWQQHLDENGYMVSSAQNVEATRKEKIKSAQSKTTAVNLSNWTFEGPDKSNGGYSGIGRISVVAFHPQNPDEFIIGAAGGGAWRTTTGGLTWTSLYSDLPVLGVSDIVYNPLNPDVIYLCTGDRDASDTYSIGVLKSTDGGITWNPTGLQFAKTDFELTNSLIINPQDTNTLLVATSDGIYRTFNAGNTWTKVRTGNHKQILYKPNDTSVIYAASNGGGNGNVWRSTDGGSNWANVTGFNDASRVQMGVCTAYPNIVKAVVSNSDNGLHGIYNSTDDGAIFYKIFGDPNDCETNILSGNVPPTAASCSGQGWYDLCIAINPTDPDKVLVGGVNTYYSSNGGANWTIVNQWNGQLPGIKTVHADKHFLAYHPLTPNVLFECNDGGIYKTSDPSSTLWTDISNGLGISQFYRLAVSNIANYVVSGAQDNGTKKVNFSGTFKDLTGGDGMDCQMDYSNASIIYSSSQYGNFRRSTDAGNNFTNISGNIPGHPEGEWITPFIIHPQDPTQVLAGYDHVYSSFNKGSTWMDISPTLPSNQKMHRLAMSPDDYNTIYALWEINTLRYTTDFGNTWQPLPNSYGSYVISDILADPKNKDILWITFAGYGNNKVSRYKAGTGWVLQNQNLPNVPINCIAIDSSNGTQYVGTDIGVYFRDTSTNQWSAYKNGLPNIEVTDLGINYATNELWASTYGRGLWKSPRHRDTTQVIVGIASFAPFALDVIKVSPNPNNGSFQITTANEALKYEAVSIRIVGFDGREIFRNETAFDAAGRINISMGNVSKGNYVVEVFSKNKLFATAKLLVL